VRALPIVAGHKDQDGVIDVLSGGGHLGKEGKRKER
jgi:hypothetical protein